MKNVLHLGVESDGTKVDLNLEILLKTRMLLAASSGAGKSETIRKICALVAPIMPVFLIDPEEEFADLRAILPFVLAGPGGETAASVPTAELLAHRLLELGASAIIDIFELPPSQRHEYVKRFLTAMIDAPKKLWRPCLVIVDEAHVFAPERGYPPSVASEAMASMASRGRKRGYGLVMATQRLAGLSNETASLCENQLVGRTMPQDQPAAARLLSYTTKAEKDAFGKTIRSVKDGEFFAMGRAFNLVEPKLFRVERVPQHGSTAKKGARHAPPPTPRSIRDLLPKLADLPQEVEAKAKTEADYRAEIVELKKQLRTINTSGITPERERMLLEQIDALQKNATTLQRTATAYERAMDSTDKMLEGLGNKIAQARTDIAKARELPIPQPTLRAPSTPVHPVHAVKPSAPQPTLRPKPPADGEALSGPEQRIVNALAWFHALGIEEPEQPAVAFMAGYTYGSGGYNNPRGRLNARGFVQYIPGDKLRLTEAGEAMAQAVEMPATNEALHAAVLSKLGGPEGRILTPLLKAYPKGIDNESLAAAANYAPNSGGYNNPRGRLKSLGLVRYESGKVVANDLLFPEGR